MRFFMNWIVSPLCAWGLQRVTDQVLPIDMERFWVILIGGCVAILWLNLINDPIKKAFP